jgi:Ca-activated chloride channel family protein
MIHFVWPWMLLLLPLPWLVGRLMPPAKPQGSALFLPFAATVSNDMTHGSLISSPYS